MIYPEYFEGTDTKKFKHLPSISSYNSNYYNGIMRDLLFAKSDDDNTTVWYILKNNQYVYLGESYANEGDKLHRFEFEKT